VKLAWRRAGSARAEQDCGPPTPSVLRQRQPQPGNTSVGNRIGGTNRTRKTLRQKDIRFPAAAKRARMHGFQRRLGGGRRSVVRWGTV